MILRQSGKEKKLDLSKFFKGEEAFIYIKYISRDVWRYINKLQLKTADVIVYTNINKKKPKTNFNLEEEILTEYQKLDENLIKKSFELELEKNRLLIKHGVDTNKHNFTNEQGDKIQLDYEILQNCVFFDYLIQEIIKFNSEFDVLERS